MQHFPNIGDRIYLPDGGSELMVVVETDHHEWFKCILAESLKTVDAPQTTVLVGELYPVSSIRFAYHKPIKKHVVYTDK